MGVWVWLNDNVTVSFDGIATSAAGTHTGPFISRSSSWPPLTVPLATGELQLRFTHMVLMVPGHLVSPG